MTKSANSGTIVNGAKWTTISMIVSSVVQMLKIIILTRFLTQTDYGLMAIVLLVLGFTNLFADLGMGVALMHKQNVTVKQFSSLYWIYIGLSVCLFGLLCLFTPFISMYYSENILNKLIPLMGLELLIVPLGKLYGTIKEKCFEFKFIALLTISAVIISLIFSIILAVYGFGVYSLIYSALLQTTIIHMGYLLTTWRRFPLKFYLSYQEAKPFLKIGIFQSGAVFLDYLSSQIDIILIGRLFGTETLGVYNLAKQLVVRIFVLINSVINRVALPFFAKIQDDILQIRKVYSQMLTILAAVNFPIYAFLALYSHSVVTLLYDSAYIEVAPLLTLLAGSGTFPALNNFSSIVITALGRTDLSFKWTWIRLIVTPLVVWGASFYSVQVLAGAISVLGGLLYFLYWRFIFYQVTKMSLQTYFQPLIPVLIVTMLTMTVCFCFSQFINSKSVVIVVLLNGFIFGLVYIGFSYLFNRQMWFQVKNIVLNRRAYAGK